METIPDFEEMLALLERHGVRYLVIGGLAAIYHAKPRYTKDMDLWVGPDGSNVEKANRVLEAFPSPWLFEPGDVKQIVQIGVEPDRIDLILDVQGTDFEQAWADRIRDTYGDVEVNWVDLETLIRMKEPLTAARHVEDVRVLKRVRELRAKRRDAAPPHGTRGK